MSLRDGVGGSGSVPGSLAGAQGGLFLRKSSGLVRELGMREALSVALSGINPAVVVMIFFVYVSFASNADLTVPYLVAAILMIPLTLTYGQLVASMPRSGGDFIYLSRIFHPVVGASIGVGFVLFAFLNIGSNAAFIGALALPEFFRATGVALNLPALVTFAGTLTQPLSEFISAGIIVLLVCLVGFRGSGALGRAMFWCFVAALVGLAFFVFQALTHSNADFQSAYDHANGVHAYQGVIAAAHDAGIQTGSTLAGFVAILPFAAIGFWGFTVGNYPAGEIKRPGSTYTSATLAGLLGGAVFLAVAWLAIKQMAGLDFLQAASALSSSDPTKFSQITGGAPVATQYYADLVSGDPVSPIVISAAFVIGSLMFIFVMVLIVSRLVFALSFDRLLPQWISDVSERSHAPTKALAVALVGGLIFVYLTIYQTGIVHLARNSVLIWAFVFTVGSIAGVALPFRRKDLYDASPKVISGSWLGLPPIAVIAALSAVIQGALLLIAATNASISGGYDPGSIATLVSFGVVGILVYAVSRAYARRRLSIDVDLAMRELPPE